MTDDEIILIPERGPNPVRKYMSGANRAGMSTMLRATALAAAFGIPVDQPRRKARLYEYDKTHCCKCDTAIPPGRAGRMCKVCRGRAENDEMRQALSAGLWVDETHIICDPVSKQGGDLSPVDRPTQPQTGEDDVA